MTLGVQNVFGYVSCDTLIDNVDMNETDRVVAKFFLCHQIQEGKISASQIRRIMQGLMPEDNIALLVKRKPVFKRVPSKGTQAPETPSKSLFLRVPSIERLSSSGSKVSSAKNAVTSAWARIRGSGASGAVLATAVKTAAITRRPTAESSVDAIIEEEEDNGETMLSYEDLNFNVKELITHLKVKSGEIAPLINKFKIGASFVLDAQKKQKESEGGFFRRLPSIGSVGSQVLVKLRRAKQTSEVTPFESVSRTASIVSQPPSRVPSSSKQPVKPQASQDTIGTTQGESQVLAFSASEAGVHRRLKAAISKLDALRAKEERARAGRSLVMNDVESELLEVQMFNLEEVDMLTLDDSLPGTPSQPARSRRGTRPGTKDSATTPRLAHTQILSSGEFSRPTTGGDRPGTGELSRPSTEGSGDNASGRESPLISKQAWA